MRRLGHSAVQQTLQSRSQLRLEQSRKVAHSAQACATALSKTRWPFRSWSYCASSLSAAL